MALGTLILLLLASYGVYRIFRFSKIRAVRQLRVAYKRLFKPWTRKELFSCPICLGTHVGVAMVPLSFMPTWVLLPPAMAAGVFLVHQASTTLDEINYLLDNA